MPAGARSAGRAYLVAPEHGPGPGVLVLHSWWGLAPGVKATVEALADAGFTALAPDLLDGGLPGDIASAARALQETDPNATAALILSSIAALRAHSADPGSPVAVLGYSMGGSWALWAGARQPASIRAVVSYYGHTDVDFADLRAPVLCHFATDDALVSEDEIVELESHLRLLGHAVEVHRYEGTRHFFAEEAVPVMDRAGDAGERNAAERAAAARAWQRTLELLHATARAAG